MSEQTKFFDQEATFAGEVEDPTPSRSKTYFTPWRLPEVTDERGRKFYARKTGETTAVLVLPVSKGKYGIYLQTNNPGDRPTHQGAKKIGFLEHVTEIKDRNGNVIKKVDMLSGQFTEFLTLTPQQGRFVNAFVNDERDRDGNPTGRKLLALSIPDRKLTGGNRQAPRPQGQGASEFFDDIAAQHPQSPGSSDPEPEM
jgi:hypothetical protein